ncbi:hypothetical protein HPB47_021439 [Ixodes persulcatus]|uniref:Uncharacterized protein n=1 Tax=Ixodes persulcatus TaxID=34615 RepID=A0AC60QFQ6_IXOPE|nr:hypothetical protein HPB47_021439 [Ixodes persulcatus]
MRDKRAWPSLSAAPRQEAAPRAVLGAVSRRSPAKFVTARVPKYINGIYHFGTNPVSKAPPSQRDEEHCCQTEIACGFTFASSTRVPRDVKPTCVPQSAPRGAEGKTPAHSWLPDGPNAHRMELRPSDIDLDVILEGRSEGLGEFRNQSAECDGVGATSRPACPAYVRSSSLDRSGPHGGAASRLAHSALPVAYSTTVLAPYSSLGLNLHRRAPWMERRCAFAALPVTYPEAVAVRALLRPYHGGPYSSLCLWLSRWGWLVGRTLSVPDTKL